MSEILPDYQKIVDQIDFDQSSVAGINLKPNPTIGYLYNRGDLDDHQPPEGNAYSVELLGFGNPNEPFFPAIGEPGKRSVTNFAYLPDGMQTIDHNGKGVGARMYNTPQATLGRVEQDPADIDAYFFRLDLRNILDLRLQSKRSTVAKHASRMLRARIFGVERVVKGIHESFAEGNEQVDAVLYNQPPRAILRQRKSEVDTTSPIKPEFMVIRSSAIVMKKIGSVDLTK